jgi:hypothetical protein
MTGPAQAGWVENTLCAFNQAGIQKAAYWSLYDAYTTFSQSPWSEAGQVLAWDGYWGLAYDEQSNGNKPAWSVIQQYYQNGSLNCPSGGTVNATPFLSLTPWANYYTINQPIRATWTASDISSISIPGAAGTLDCNVLTRAPISSSVAVASCASTDGAAATTSGNYTVTASALGTNGNPYNQTAVNATVQIGLGPVLAAVTNQNYGSTISATGGMLLRGRGFANENTNAIQCTRSGYSDVWLTSSNGISHSSNTQIDVDLQSRLAPGDWILKEWNGWSGYSSGTYQVTITQ